MELLGELGIDIKLLIAQIINFGLLLFILTKLMYQPIIDRIERDERKLQEAEQRAAELKAQEAELEKRKTMEIAKARRRSQKIIKEAEEIAMEIRKRAKEETEKEKEAVIAQLRKRLKRLEQEDV